MRSLLSRLSLLLGVMSLPLLAAAGDSIEVKPLRPVLSAYMIDGGGARLVNTYLTPLKYSGWATAFNYERMQAMKFSPDRWVMLLRAGVTLNRTQNPAHNATMWRLTGEFSWGMMHRWRLPYGITLAAGGSTGLDLGCLYSTRNGNNPVAVEAAWTVNLTGYAAWNCRIGRLPVTLRYQPVLPVAGVFFSPEYGELFYEISLGDDDGLAHAAWWGNYFRMENLVTADLHFGATSLRVGFRSNIISTKVNNITTRVINSSAVIGIAGEWLSLRPGKGLDPVARIISALY